MICRNGEQLIAKCGIGKRGEMGAARGFFEVFWMWSMVGCQNGGRRGARFIHTGARPKAIQSRSPPQLGIQKWPTNPLPQVRRSSLKTKPQDEDQGRNEPKEPPLSTCLRRLMRSLPHSVVVLTTSVPQSSLQTATQISPPISPMDYRGMTLSSFTTLTLTPEPIITFNIKQPSRTLAALSQSRHFLIHILEASENGMKIADAFTKGNTMDRSLFLDMKKEVFEVEERIVRNWDGAQFTIPMLKVDGVVKVLRCVVVGRSKNQAENERTESERKESGLISVGDHVLVLGKVEEILGGEGEGAKSGLCYADGRYRRIGDVIEEKKDEKE